MILSKLKLVENIVNEISDNSTGDISPHDIRHNLLDIIDSVHLLTIGYPLKGSNFETPSTRTTKVGYESIEKLGLEGYFSIDNSAFGFGSLRSNYQGIRNTAIGSQSLGCNVYGEENIGLGYHSLGGNTVGHYNIGLGNYALKNNKQGNNNVAIGNAAGYYVNKDTNNKLFIASYPADEQYLCDNPLGSGLVSLIYGDFQSQQLGINTEYLHGYGSLQISGDISPTIHSYSSLGHSFYGWKNLYITDSIFFDNSVAIHSSGSSIQSSGDLLPSLNNTYDIGSQSNLWKKAYLNDLLVSGIAVFNRVKALERCDYFCKTINLASASGHIDTIDGGGPDSIYEYANQDHESQLYSCGLLKDEELSGAGLVINASGIDYLRAYKFEFLPPNSNISCLNNNSKYGQATWNSNISLHLGPDAHFKTERILFPSGLGIVSQNDCRGAFLLNNNWYFGKSSDIEVSPSLANSTGRVAGIGNFNLLSPSGSTDDFIFNISSFESGVKVAQRFLSSTKIREKDVTTGKDKLSGFELRYFDDANIVYSNINEMTDRLVIGSYNKTHDIVNAITLRKQNGEGILGINNLSPASQNILPDTSLNIRTNSNAIARLTAENQNKTVSAIQLLGGSNCLEDGFEIQYYNGSGLSDISSYKDSGKFVFLRFNANSNTLGLFNASGSPNAPLTFGDSFTPNAIFSFHEASGGWYPTPKYDKLYARPKIAPLQGGTLFLIDGSGNSHDLVVNKFDINDARALYTDNLGNTFGGILCPDRRDDIVLAEKNTAIGNRALRDITSGDNNTVFGFYSGSGITIGSNNTIFGGDSAKSLITGNSNIVVGYNSFNSVAPSSTNNVILGNNINYASYLSNRFILGSSKILLDGIMGPNDTDKRLSLPSGGNLLIENISNTEALRLKANLIESVDRGGSNYPDSSLEIKFTGNNSNTLVSFNHDSDPMTNVPVYQAPIPPRPYQELNGDFKLRGSIRFSDATSLSSANFLSDIDVLESGVEVANSGINSINNRLSSLIVEGYVQSQINKPSSGSNPTSGILIKKNQGWNNTDSIFITNRDITNVIHAGAYVVAIKINDEYRPLWISASDTSCECCGN